ncbi:phosphoglycerate kinase [Candidatus Pacearchaeota archaeon]|nr:phosphoglycerate kinase [Candidatus Pacearchaeota archaeon]
MPIDFTQVNKLEDTIINPGEKWVYSADANDPKLKRVDEELEDLKQISDNQGITIILAHEGRFGKAKPLDFVASHLTEKLGKEVKYFPENNTPAAIEFVNSLKARDIAVLGNTRFHEGEEKNDSQLAEQFAALVGKEGKVAIGGFGKAHRKNASNTGILNHLLGYLTRSQQREMEKLEKWAGEERRLSIAILGGIKGEKIKDGLAGFIETYDFIIPGGIVLNTLYYVLQKTIKKEEQKEARDSRIEVMIGKSVVDDEGKTFFDEVEKVLELYPNKILFPQKVRIAKKEDGAFGKVYEIKSCSDIPEEYMIVDFVLSESAKKGLEKCVLYKGRIVMAGTPGIYTAGFCEATDSIVEYMNQNPENSIALGGDTVSDIKSRGKEFNANSSTGGGSALYFIAHGTTPVFEALKENKKRFP